MIEQLFDCKKCGYCCHGDTTVSLSAEDQERMLKVLGITRQEALQRFWRQTGEQVQMKTRNGHCIFYQDGCTVHPGRPFRCRQWPLVDAIVKDKVNYQTIAASCPGLSHDIEYSDVCDAIRNGGLIDEP